MDEVKTELNQETTDAIQTDVIDQETNMKKLRQQAYANFKEQKALSKFDKERWKDCPNGFLIQNKKTNRMVEIRAPTVLMAISAVGWRPRHTKLIKEIDYSKQLETYRGHIY